jgi:hypothetical protein
MSFINPFPTSFDWQMNRIPFVLACDNKHLEVVEELLKDGRLELTPLMGKAVKIDLWKELFPDKQNEIDDISRLADARGILSNGRSTLLQHSY